jgi:transglutaminase-like putative cysteine protease
VATKPDDASRRQRLASLGAIAFVVAATAFAFGRVFVGQAPTMRLLTAGLLSVAVAAAFERHSLVLATIASAVALIAALGLLVYPETLWYGLPGGQTLEAIGHSLGRVGAQARSHVAPTQALEPLMLAAMTAVWTAAFSAHALAARAGSPLLAVLPSAALIGFADTVLEDGARPMYALLLLVSALLLVFVDSMRRIRQWGPVWTAPGRRRLSSVAGRGARRVGAVAVGAALLLPGILPGFRADPLVDLSSSGGADIDIDPFVSIGAQLRRAEEKEVFRVRSLDVDQDLVPAYWRLRALDEFDGASWRTSDPTGEFAFTIMTPQIPLRDFVPGDTPIPTFTQQVTTIQDIDERKWLPAAYPPKEIRLPEGQARLQPIVDGLQAGTGIASDEGYTVTSYLVRPTPAELRAVPFVEGAYAGWTNVPAAVGATLRQVAQEWTGGLRTQYDRVFEIQSRFLRDDSGFEYTLDPERIGGTNPILAFLTQTREGFCQQFATTMAAMLRSIGIPARVAVGYRTGTEVDGTFRVTNHDAHAWVEVLFPGYGWLAFDPTPGGWSENRVFEQTPYMSGVEPQPNEVEDPRRFPVGGSTTPPGCSLTGAAVQGRICSDPTALATPTPLIGLGGPPRRDILGGVGGEPLAPQQDPYGIPLRPVLAVLGLLVLALIVLVPIVKATLRRRMLHHGHDPRMLVLTAYRVFDGEAADVGMGRRPGETIAEHRARLASTVRFSDGHLDRLAAATESAAYSEATVDTETVRAARHDAKVAIKDVWRHAGPVRRLLGLYRPKV